MRTRYLAALFLAALATDRGELQQARSRYESAVTLCPGCQSALVGGAFIDALAASGAGAASDIDRLFQTQRRTDPDPWIAYQFPQLDSDTLDVLRAEVRR